MTDDSSRGATQTASAGAPPATVPDDVPPADGYGIANAALVLLLTRIASVLLAWALEVLLVRMMTPTEWSGMSRFLTLVGAFGIAQFGFPESVLYFAAKTDSWQAGLRLTMRTSALLAGLGVLLGLPFCFAPALTERALGSDGGRLLVPLMVFVTSDLAFSPLPSFLLAHKQPRLASALSIGTRIPIAASVIFALASGLPLPEALYFMAAGSLLSLFGGWATLLYVSARKGASAGLEVSLAEQVRFSLPVGLTKLVQIANVKLDKYIVMMVFAETVFGTYYLGAAEFPLPSMICSAVMTIMMADLVRAAGNQDRAPLLRLWRASIEKIALLVLPMFVFCMFFADVLFVAFYGAEHVGAAAQFRIFSLLLLARVTNYTFVSLALGQPRVPFVAAGIAMTFNVALSFIFVRTLGIIGPAVANVVAIYLSTIYTLHAIRVALGRSWRELFPLRRYLSTLGLAALAGVVALAVFVLRLPPLVTVIAGAVVLLGVFAALASLTGLLTANDWQFLGGVVRLRFLRSTPKSAATALTPDRGHHPP